MSFFQGTLQEGIATAVQQLKSVVCFVTDNGTESTQWENEYLADDAVAPLVQSEAVALRLEAGSQEEAFLAQLYPIPKKPTIVIIKNAVLKEYIASGVSKEDFVVRMQHALQPAQPAAAPPQLGSLPAPTPATAPPQPEPSPIGESTSSTSSGRATPLSSNETQIQSVLAERAARLAVEKKKQEEETRKRRLEKGKAKADDAPTPESQRKHADQYKKKQQQAREERERILRAIEDDKAARRAKKAEMEAIRRAAAAEETEPKPESDVPFAPASPLFPTSGRISEHCALQVRLFNGSTIRSRFSSHDTLKDVRQWIDDTPSDSPKAAYTFKILLTPLPSKTIDVTEESKQLHELGLTPSATLILLPAPKTAARAFAAAPGEGNIITRVIASLLAFISGLIGLIVSFFSTLFSTAGPPGGPTQESTTAGDSQARASGRDSGRIADPRRNWSERRNDQQFYNGNSTNFEPRPDDDDDDDE